MPATTAATRTPAQATEVRRQAAGRNTGATARKYTAPASATGTCPNSIDCVLVVTFVQLMPPVAGQASAAGSV